MNINWSTQVTGPYGITIPTYGNYGGPGYSDGEILAFPTQPVDYSSPPVDPLDALFLLHDQSYDSLDPAVRAQGDLALAEGIADLPRGQMDPEESLYGGLAILFAVQQIVQVNDHPELLSAHETRVLTNDALHLIERGLAKAGPDDIAGIHDWLQQTAETAAHDGQTNLLDQAVAFFDDIEFRGHQVWVGDTHLSGRALDEAVMSLVSGLSGSLAAPPLEHIVDEAHGRAEAILAAVATMVPDETPAVFASLEAHLPHHWGLFG